MVRKPSLLILDEATANLDSATEAEIVKVLKEVSKNVITLIVSHRDGFAPIATQVLELGHRQSESVLEVSV
jgi:ABC-type transport system involved in cytochrome bd biosynthesis fused ATPase/permease subunit